MLNSILNQEYDQMMSLKSRKHLGFKVRFQFERLEDRLAPAGLMVAGAGPGGGPQVVVYDGTSKDMIASFFAYDPSFRGGVNAVAADINNDGVLDIVTGPGPGGGPHVRAFDGVTFQPILDLFAFDPSFLGGVSVAVGDVNGDGRPEVITGAGPGGGPHVTVWDPATKEQLFSFFPYNSFFNGGVNVAVADIDGDGVGEIVTGAGPGGGPHVLALGGADMKRMESFYAYDSNFRGGVNVTAADLDGDGHAEIITGAGPGGGPHVKVFVSGVSQPLDEFFAFDANFRGGVSVSTCDYDGNGAPEIMAGAGPGGSPHISIYDSFSRTLSSSFHAFDQSFDGGVHVNGTASIVQASKLIGDGTPYSTLTIAGKFIPNVATTVVFKDGAGYKIEVPVEEVTANSVRVGVPPFFSAKSGEFGASPVPPTGQSSNSSTGVVTVQVAQAPVGTHFGGALVPVQIADTYGSVKSNSLPITIKDLPQTGLAAGEVTRAFLEGMIEATQTAIDETQALANLSNNPADTAKALEGLQEAHDRYVDVLADVNKLISGQVAEIDFAAVGSQSVKLTKAALGVHDRLIAASLGQASSTSGSRTASRSSSIADTDILQNVKNSLAKSVSQAAEDIKSVTGPIQRAGLIASGLLIGAAAVASTPAVAGALATGAAFAAMAAGAAWVVESTHTMALKQLAQTARNERPNADAFSSFFDGLTNRVGGALVSTATEIAQMLRWIQPGTKELVEWISEFSDFTSYINPSSWFQRVVDWSFPQGITLNTPAYFPTNTTSQRPGWKWQCNYADVKHDSKPGNCDRPDLGGKWVPE